MVKNLNGIDVFVAVVEAGSFSETAGRMHLSRSAVAKTIARLEARAGARLFHRSTRRQGLTADGQIYYERCVRALAELEAAEAMLESGRREAVGRLNVSVPIVLGRRCVAPILTRLAARHPKLELHVSLSDRPVDLVEDGVDLAVRNGPVAAADDLIARRVASQRLALCAAPAYLRAHPAPRSLADVETHVAIGYARDGRVTPWRFPTEEGERLLRPKSRLHFDDLEAIADAAVAGSGLAWLPVWLIADRLAEGSLVTLLDDMPGFRLETVALWPRSRPLPFRVRAAIDALVDELPKLEGMSAGGPLG